MGVECALARVVEWAMGKGQEKSKERGQEETGNEKGNVEIGPGRKAPGTVRAEKLKHEQRQEAWSKRNIKPHLQLPFGPPSSALKSTSCTKLDPFKRFGNLWGLDLPGVPAGASWTWQSAGYKPFKRLFSQKGAPFQKETWNLTGASREWSNMVETRGVLNIHVVNGRRFSQQQKEVDR